MTDMVDRARSVVCSNGACPGVKLRWEMADEIEKLRAGLQDISAIEGLCVKPWTGVKCEGCQCGYKGDEG